VVIIGGLFGLWLDLLVFDIFSLIETMWTAPFSLRWFV